MTFGKAFLHAHLRAARVGVRLVAFERTDVRLERRDAEDARVCVRPLYYSCGPQLLRTRRLLPMCALATDARTWERELFRRFSTVR